MVESTLHSTFYLESKSKLQICVSGKEHQLVVAKISKAVISKTADPILMNLFCWDAFLFFHNIY